MKSFSAITLIALSVGLATAPGFSAARASECLRAAAQALQVTPTSGRVEHPTPGLYEGVPIPEMDRVRHDEGIPGLRISASRHGSGRGDTFITDLTYAPRELPPPLTSPAVYQGKVERWFSRDRTEMRFVHASLGDAVPSFVAPSELPEMVQGRGIPTQAYLTLQQMRAAGVPYGGLKSAAVVHIGNVRTILEVYRHPTMQAYLGAHPELRRDSRLPADVLSQAVEGCHSVEYARTVLTQSGHRIVRIAAGGGELKPLGVVAAYWQQFPEVQAEVARAGLSDSTLVPTDFRIDFELAPIESPAPTGKD